MSDCPTRRVLECFLVGGLGDEEEAGLCAHVEWCSACQGELERLVAGPAPFRGPDRSLGDPGHGLDLAFLDELPGLHSGPAWLPWHRGEAGDDPSRSVGTPVPRLHEAVRSVPGYEIIGEMGRGAMGVVYKARQLSLGRITALKMILAGEHAGMDDRTRFRTEAEAAGSLRHPNIVQVYETGESGGLMYFSMEYVEGETLKERLRGTPQPARAAALLLEAMARAVDYAHCSGIIHRDLKPANVLLDAGDLPLRSAAPDGLTRKAEERARLGLVPKIADFGLAKRVGDFRGTRTGQLLGTPGYMAPEQLSGEGRAVSPAVDIYALGCILYEVLTGRPPFLDASLEALAARVLREDPVPPRRLQPNVPRDLETVCLKCLEKDPSRRYASALDLADDLERFLAGGPIRARRQAPSERLVRWAQRHREGAAALVVILLLMLATFVGSLLAAAYFKRMEGEQRQLALRNSALARENQAERRKAEAARDQARASQGTAELTLADMATVHGLQAAEVGRDREAVLWFAEAARVAASDPVRRRANLIRTLAWSRRASRPAAVLQHPGGVPLTLAFHAGGRYLLSTPAPYPGDTVVWDLTTEQPLAMPGRLGAAVATAAAWSPDGERLALGTRDGVTLYRFPGLTEPRHVTTGAAPTLLRFSGDGDQLAVATGPVVRVWEERRGTFVTGRLEHPTPVLTLEFTPDGARLVSADEGGEFRVFALGTGRDEPELTGRHRKFGGRWTVHAPWIDPTGTRLVTVSASSELTWWDLAVRERVGRFSSLGGQVCHIAPSPDGSLLAVTVEERGVAIVDATKREVVTRMERGQAGMLSSAFSPDGRTLFVAGAHPEAQQWGLPEGTWLGTPAVEATGFRAAAFSQDGRLLATAGYENQVRVWALARPDSHEFAVPTGGAVARGTFSADSRLLLARLRGKSARVYRVADGSGAGPPLRPDGDLVEAAFTPDARTVVTVAAAPEGGGLVDFWDWGAGRRRFPTMTTPSRPLVLGVDASGRVAVLCRDGLLRLLDAPTGRVIREWRCGATEQPPEDVGVDLGGDGRTVLAAINGRLQVWDGATGRLRFDPPQHPDLLYAALSADGRLIASVGADSALRLWDARTGERRGPALVHPSWVDGGVDFHADGRHVLTICKDTAMRVWDVATGRLAAPPIRPTSIGAARFSPEAGLIVTAGYDGTVEVWDWRAGRLLLPPRKLPLATDWAYAGNRTVQISPDGRHVAVGGRPELHILSLADLYPAEAGSPDDLNAWAELISHHRVHKGGTLAHLSGEEWARLWHDLRRNHVRLAGDSAPMTHR
jgi:serine/threonine protein kinase/WD40 repeat protein